MKYIDFIDTISLDDFVRAIFSGKKYKLQVDKLWADFYDFESDANSIGEHFENWLRHAKLRKFI